MNMKTFTILQAAAIIGQSYVTTRDRLVRSGCIMFDPKPYVTESALESYCIDNKIAYDKERVAMLFSPPLRWARKAWIRGEFVREKKLLPDHAAVDALLDSSKIRTRRTNTGIEYCVDDIQSVLGGQTEPSAVPPGTSEA